MSGRLPPGPAGTRLPRITLCPVTRVAPFSHLHKQIAISLHPCLEVRDSGHTRITDG